jgi:hypothetical protein
MVAEIYRKEGDDDELHDSILTANGDGDDAARERNPPRRCRFVARGPESGTQVFAHELGRGHRRMRAAAASHALGRGRGSLRASSATCNIPLTNAA